MKTRMKRLISLITAAALCLSCIPISVVYASDEIISEAEVVREDIDDGIAISEAEIPEQADAEVEHAGADQALTDEELVSATAPVQASKSSQDGEYVGRATTMQSGPANPRTPKTYTLDLSEKNYPTKVSWQYYGDYMQGVGILYPGDKVVILPETDPNPGGYGSHGEPGKILKSRLGDWLELSQGQDYGSLRISKSITLGAVVSHTYVTEVEIVNSPILINYSGSGNGSTNKWAVESEAVPHEHDASYWGASTMVWVGLPKYHPVVYTFENNIGSGNSEDITNLPGKVFAGDNPTVIYAEDLSCNYNPIDGNVVTGPIFTIHHPKIKGYRFQDVGFINDTKADIYYSPKCLEFSADRMTSQWRFFFDGADNYRWSFDNQIHGSEEDPIKIHFKYQEARTVSLNGNGGTVDNVNESINVYKYRMNLHPHAVLNRVLWRWYQSPSGFKPLWVF